MEITLTISEKAAKIIEEQAAERDMRLADLASDLLEDKVQEEFPEGFSSDEPHPLMKIAGMFASGISDTSSRYKEILLEDIKMPGGFGGG